MYNLKDYGNSNLWSKGGKYLIHLGRIIISILLIGVCIGFGVFGLLLFGLLFTSDKVGIID